MYLGLILQGFRYILLKNTEIKIKNLKEDSKMLNT